MDQVKLNEVTRDVLHLFAEELPLDQFVVDAEELASGVAAGFGCFSTLSTFGSACSTASSGGCLGTFSQ